MALLACPIALAYEGLTNLRASRRAQRRQAPTAPGGHWKLLLLSQGYDVCHGPMHIINILSETRVLGTGASLKNPMLTDGTGEHHRRPKYETRRLSLAAFVFVDHYLARLVDSNEKLNVSEH